MFENAGPGLYGTAEPMDYVHVTLAAIGFCVAAGTVAYLAVQLLMSLS